MQVLHRISTKGFYPDPNAPDHKDFKPLNMDLHAGILHRAKLAVELEVAMTTGPIESLNFRNIFPRHPDLRFDFDPIEYLSKPSLDLSPVADFRDRILMRMFINSLRWLALDIHRPLLHSHSKFCDFDFTQFLTDLDEYVF